MSEIHLLEFSSVVLLEVHLLRPPGFDLSEIRVYSRREKRQRASSIVEVAGGPVSPAGGAARDAGAAEQPRPDSAILGPMIRERSGGRGISERTDGRSLLSSEKNCIDADRSDQISLESA